MNIVLKPEQEDALAAYVSRLYVKPRPDAMPSGCPKTTRGYSLSHGKSM